MLPRLLLLVLVAVLPAFGMQFYNRLQLTQEREDEVRRNALDLAGDRSARYGITLEAVRRSLAVAAAALELPGAAGAGNGGPACNDLLARTRDALGDPVVLARLDRQGRIVCSANGALPDPGGGVDTDGFADDPRVRSALAEGRVAVLRDTRMPASSATLAFLEPILSREGGAEGAIVAWYPLDRLDPADRGELPEGGRLLLAGHDGTILRSVGNAPDLAPGSRLPPLLSAIATGGGQPASVTIRDADGTDIAFGVVPRAAPPADLFIAVGVPTSPALHGIADATGRTLLVMAATLAGTMLLAWAGGRRIIRRPLERLGEAARQLADGRWSGPVSTLSGPPELRRLAGAFDEMATALQARTAALTASEQAARQLRRQLMDAIQSMQDGFVLYDSEDRLVLSNDRDRALFPAMGHAMQPGTPRHEIVRAASAAGYRPVEFADDDAFLAGTVGSRPETGREFDTLLPDGRWIHIREFRTSDGGLVSLRTDQTESRRRDEQLRQAQKMEAVGQLTGGIAHDFNNLLTVILGNAELLAEELETAQPELREMAEMSRTAAERGAELTRRLLYFARHQATSPTTVDVNALLLAIEPMLVRTLGDDIQVRLMPGPGLWAAECDTTQLETTILNLSVNARDAMPGGGHLTIRTENSTLAQATAGDLRPGDYVRIAVSDTGVGMTAETMRRAFEPFYTTKEDGRGSGLGLSMVYGFARQSRGQVQIDSAPGLGTTVVLLLPRAALPLSKPERARARERAVGGSEAVLIVEDNGAVRDFVSSQLRSLGYMTTATANAAEALLLLDQGASVDLLFSDIMMPGGMNGHQLAAEALRRRPSLKVLLTTGFNDVPAEAAPDPDLPILQKPYLKHVLARRIREVLDR